MSEPACKKARIDKSRLKIAKQIPSWLDLEPGIWESVFRLLNGAEDKKIVRLVCKSFQATANRTISHLELRNSIADDSNLSELAVSLPLFLCICKSCFGVLLWSLLLLLMAIVPSPK